MVKRSQNKKRFTPVNYKQRWFVLTRRYLVYYDGDGEVSILRLFLQSPPRHILSAPCFYFSFHYLPHYPIAPYYGEKVGSISGISKKKRFFFL